MFDHSSNFGDPQFDDIAATISRLHHPVAP